MSLLNDNKLLMPEYHHHATGDKNKLTQFMIRSYDAISIFILGRIERKQDQKIYSS